jgi:hypothetical protein
MEAPFERDELVTGVELASSDRLAAMAVDFEPLGAGCFSRTLLRTSIKDSAPR